MSFATAAGGTRIFYKGWGAEVGAPDHVPPRLDRVLEKHRHVVRLVPALLDPGDQIGRLFAMSVVRRVKSPELLEALREFCQSQRGTDEMRMEAAEFLREENILPDAPLRIWLNGAWVDIELLAFEVYHEPVPDHWKDPRSEELAAEANEALYAGDSERAERLLNRCLQMEGEHPTLLNNLAAAYQRQNQTDKARAGRKDLTRMAGLFFRQGRPGAAGHSRW